MPDTREDRRKAYKQMIADIRARKMSTQDENQVKMENAQQRKKTDAAMSDEDRHRMEMENAKHLRKPNPSKEQADPNLVKAEAAKESRKSQAGKFWDGMN